MRKSTPGGLKEFLNIVPFDRQNCIVFAQNLFEAVVVKESQLWQLRMVVNKVWNVNHHLFVGQRVFVKSCPCSPQAATTSKPAGESLMTRGFFSLSTTIAKASGSSRWSMKWVCWSTEDRKASKVGWLWIHPTTTDSLSCIYCSICIGELSSPVSHTAHWSDCWRGMKSPSAITSLWSLPAFFRTILPVIHLMNSFSEDCVQAVWMNEETKFCVVRNIHLKVSKRHPGTIHPSFPIFLSQFAPYTLSNVLIWFDDFNIILVGWPTPLKNVNQLAWWNSQYMEKNVPNHQPAFNTWSNLEKSISIFRKPSSSRHSECLPSAKRLQFAIENGPVEIVDLPSKMVIFPWTMVIFP